MNRQTAKRSFWSNVAAVAYKEASILRHDRALLAAVLAQPVMMFLLFGFALSNKPANVPWVVLDQSQTTLSRRLVSEVYATGYFLAPRAVAGYDEGRAALEHGEAVALVVLPSDFRRNTERERPEIQVLVDGSDPLTAARVNAIISQVAANFEIREQPEARRDDEVVAGIGAVDLRQRFWFNPGLKDRQFFLAALAGMLLTNICLSVTSLGLVAERESGTYEQMLSLPTSAIEIVLGKLVPYVGLSYVVLVFSVLGPAFVFGLWPQGSWLALLLVTLPFVLASLAVGVFVSTVARTSAQAVFVSVFFILPSFVLSGVMFPYQFMPPGVREVGAVLPLRWYQIAARRIIERGAGFAEVTEPFLILTLIFAIILVAIRWRMRPRLG